MILDTVKGFFTAPLRRDSLNSYVGPKRRRKGIPNDVGVILDFPKEIDSSKNKLLYALWREGVVPDYNLRMLSNLKTSEFTEAVDTLLSDGKITITSYKINSSESPTIFYSLVLNSH